MPCDSTCASSIVDPLRMKSALSSGAHPATVAVAPRSEGLRPGIGVSSAVWSRLARDLQPNWQATDGPRPPGSSGGAKMASQRPHTIMEIAFLLGYSDHSHFTRAFKWWTGLPPRQYANSCRR